MPEITPTARLILGMVSGGAALVALVAGNVLAGSIIAYFSGKRTAMLARPLALWVVFFISAAIAIVAGSIATLAPLASVRPLPVREAALWGLLFMLRDARSRSVIPPFYRGWLKVMRHG